MSWELSELPGPFENGLTPADALTRAVVISLFTDARADDDDEIPDGTGERRGFWADDILPPVNAPGGAVWITGSKLWLLNREKQTPETARRAREYAASALQWLITRGDAASVRVDAQWRSPGLLSLPIQIQLADGSVWSRIFNLQRT